MSVVEEREELTIDASKKPSFCHIYCTDCNGISPPQPGCKAYCGLIKKTPHHPNAAQFEKCVVCASFTNCPTCGRKTNVW